MTDYEKLGVFYLGKSYDLEQGKRGDELLLYDSKDLTTHAMIIGMTGSGKTGLGIGMIEEAAIDRIPVIAIDPKGDLTNLLLTFPQLAPSDFQPWVSQQEAAEKNMSIEELAVKTAENWKKGLADWDEDGARIARLRETVDLAIYTPGSSAGLPISVLQSFTAPPQAVRDDADLYREHIQTTASSILGLLGIDADPITSREHVLLSTILQNAWGAGQDLDVAGLIRAIQQPPFQRVGVLDVDSFFAPKDRTELAMRLNTLLAAPGFEAWMQGEPLDTGKLLFTDSGKPRVSILSIAHLSDSERMFFVSMLLGDVISWMRSQSGTGSLRAILYMDELFGYMPPVANPPSKQLFLTLLKQARAFGLGLVLSTQNPVDLDYKGLSNIGTWFIGRLQTERDKARVMEGLEGAAAGGQFDRQEFDKILAGLGKRVFLMRNVNEDHPLVFTTRWVLSYLAGPLTREQIKVLMRDRKAANAASTAAPAATVVATATPVAATPAPAVAPAPVAAAPSGPPILPNGVQQYYLPAKADGSIFYKPMVIGVADVAFSNTKYNVNLSRRVVRICALDDGPVPVNWDDSQTLAVDPNRLLRSGANSASYAELPSKASAAKSYDDWSKLLARWLRSGETMTLFQSTRLKATSKPDEDERDFRIRLQQLWREQRDSQVDALRKKYASKLSTLQERLRKAEQTIEREKAEASQQQISSIASIGSSVLGAFFGRKSGITASKISSGVGSFSRMQKASSDVTRAQENADAISQQITELEGEIQSEIDKLDQSFDAQTDTLETTEITPKSTDVTIHVVGLVWTPWLRDAQGILTQAWD